MPGIVVGVDGSHHAHRALKWAVNEAAIRNTPLTVLAVQQVAKSGWDTTIVYPEDVTAKDKIQIAAQKIVDDVVAEASNRPPSVTVRAEIGTPAEQLVSASEDADMVVVGSRGTGGFARLLLGSVGSQVAAHARCPVVLIPLEDHG
jgi:nucleotide-binding universal stress UspA family protein